MPTLRASIDINAPTDKVWDVIRDFGNIHKFNPMVPKSHLTSEQTAGEGTTRHCDLTSPGASIQERITDWQDGRSYTVSIYEMKRVPFLTDLTARVAVEPSETGSVGTFEVGYSTTAGPIGRLMDKLVIRSQYRKSAKLFVAGLKHHVETGEEVTKGVVVDRDAATLVELQPSGSLR